MPKRIKVKENTIKSTRAYSNMEGVFLRQFSSTEAVVRIDKKYEEQLSKKGWVIEPIIDLFNIIFLSDIQMEIE